MNLKQFNPTKVLNHWDAIKAIIEGENNPPISCEIDPSNICNHSCFWCINDDFRSTSRVMLPKDLMFRTIEELGDFGVKSVVFTGGGEPLTNPATIEGLYKIVEHGMETAIVTNGGLLDAKKAEAIIDTCSYARLSLDSGSTAVHREIHSPVNPEKDTFDKIIKNIKLLVDTKARKKKKCNLGVGYLVFPANYKQIYTTAKLLKEIGIDYIQIRPPYMDGVNMSDHIRIQTEKLIEEALKLDDENFHVFPIMHRFDEVSNTDRSYNKCLGHALVGVVGADGKVYLCCQLRGQEKFCFGDLREHSFKEIWKSQRRQDVINSIQLDMCPPCRYNKYNEILDYLADKERPHKNFL